MYQEQKIFSEAVDSRFRRRNVLDLSLIADLLRGDEDLKAPTNGRLEPSTASRGDRWKAANQFFRLATANGGPGPPASAIAN